MPKKISALDGVFQTMEATANPSKVDRSMAITTKIGKITVDTVIGFDTGEWETGIDRGNDWEIVEQYDSAKQAKAGHNKWVKKMKTTPKMDLPNICVWE